MEKSMTFDDWTKYCKSKYIGSKIVGRQSKKDGTDGMEYWCVPQVWRDTEDGDDRLFSAYSINKQAMVYDDPETSGKALVLLPKKYYGVDTENKIIVGPFKTSKAVEDKFKRSNIATSNVLIGLGAQLDPLVNGVRA